MKKKWKQLAAGCLAMVMLAGISNTNVFADSSYKNGKYTAKIAFLHESKNKNSMCNSLFDQDADVEIKDNTAKISIYTAFPVPLYSGSGADGTIKNMVMTLNEDHYTAESDIETKPVRTMDEAGFMFGIKKGDKLTTQVLTLTIPTEKLDSLSKAVPVTAFVNVVMNKNVNFRLRLNDLQLVEEANPSPENPDKVTDKTMELTASVGAPAANYTVTIPQSISLGTLSAEKDNITAYEVNVTADNMGAGYIEVSADKSGALRCGENSLAFTNSFGTQKVQSSTTLNGRFTVTGDAVKAAQSGNYVGTTDFVIRYFIGA